MILNINSWCTYFFLLYFIFYVYFIFVYIYCCCPKTRFFSLFKFLFFLWTKVIFLEIEERINDVFVFLWVIAVQKPIYQFSKVFNYLFSFFFLIFGQNRGFLFQLNVKLQFKFNKSHIKIFQALFDPLWFSFERFHVFLLNFNGFFVFLKYYIWRVRHFWFICKQTFFYFNYL